MTTKLISKLRAIALPLVLVVTLCGCVTSSQTGESGSDAVCFVLGKTANARELNLNSPIVRDTGMDVIEHYGYVGVVRADGSPELVLHKSYDIEAQYKKASPQKLKADARTKCTDLLFTMQNVSAVTPEVDYLEALRLASRSFASLQDCRSKTIIVVGTGLSTTGTLDFRNNLFSAEPEAVVRLLEERQEIPDFSGTTVVFQQLGEVASPQAPLTQVQRAWLKALYCSIVTAGGGSFEFVDVVSTPADPTLELPAVSVVPLPAEPVIAFPAADAQPTSETVETTVTAAMFSSPVSLGEQEVRFIPDTASFASTEETMLTLRPLADFLRSSPDLTLLLVGCIAGDTCGSGGVALSRQRAEAVRDALEDLGIPQEQLIAVGLGCYDPWHIMGAGFDGVLAAENRRVVLVDAQTATAQQLIELAEALAAS